MKFKYYIFSLKRNFFAILLIVFSICLFIFSSTNINSARNGLILWAKFIVPSLFPFFVSAELMLHTNLISFLGRLLNPFMKPLFKVPGISSIAFIIGSISGYPVGAKIITELRNEHLISQDEGNRLLAFCNNSGPLFIVATVGIGLFGSSSIGFFLLIIHLLSAISVAILLGFFAKKTSSNTTSNFSINKTSLSATSFGDILSKSILNSINTLLLIGGFVVFFSVIISILVNSKILSIIEILFLPVFNLINIDTRFISASFVGLLEITEGINRVSAIHIKNISTNILFTSFLLGFGGMSIVLQILSVIRKSDLSIKPYITGKLLQATFSIFYAYIAISCIPGLNMDLTNSLHFSVFPCIIFITFIIILCRFFG